MEYPKLYSDKHEQAAFERALYLLIVRKEHPSVIRTIWLTEGIENEDEVWNMAVFHSQICNKAYS